MNIYKILFFSGTTATAVLASLAATGDKRSVTIQVAVSMAYFILLIDEHDGFALTELKENKLDYINSQQPRDKNHQASFVNDTFLKLNT